MKYFDYAASCPLDQEAAKVYVKAATEYYGNTQSLHDIGGQAVALLENCRAKLAGMLKIEKEGLYFTSGGSESNFLGINALLSAKLKKGNHIITGLGEHSSVKNTINKLESEGYEVTSLPLTTNGMIDVSLLKQSIKPETVLISIHHGNPEIGTIQPIEAIGRICKENQILFHSDCVQTFGKTELDLIVKYADSFSISGHKVYGPKGVGALYVNPALSWQPYLSGTSHEKGIRPGTINVPAIAAMTVAAEMALSKLTEHKAYFQSLRNTLIESLEPLGSAVTIHEAIAPNQLEGIVGLRINGVEGQWVMLECNRHGFAISTGTACQVGMQSPSKTMKAMGIPDAAAKEFIRISFGTATKSDDVSQLGNTLLQIARQAGSSS